jgi:uncharacterized OB-fold protein
MPNERHPAIEGWFTIDDEPALLGQKCAACGTIAFPPVAGSCPNPACLSDDLAKVPLSRSGTVWSYTDAHYQPPSPYVPTTDPYEPFAIAAVELEVEQIIVLGQVAAGFGIRDLEVGSAVDLVLEPLETKEGIDHLIWRWRPRLEAAQS